MGIEFVECKDTRAPFPPALNVSGRIADRAFNNGRIVGAGKGSIDGVNGDHINLAPPFICTEEHLEEIVSILSISIEEVHVNCDVASPAPALTLSRQGIPVREIIALTRMKRAVAEHMSNCHQKVASVSVFADFNVDALIEACAAGLFDVDGVRVTPTHVLIRLVAETLRKFPLLNASIEDDTIQVDEINIDMAAALPDGNLIVPIIRNADRLSIGEIAAEAGRLAALAARGKLGLADIRGGTFTLTNVGMVRGTLWQTPLVNLPQAGILALGRIREAPVARSGQLAVGNLMGTSLSFDHRIMYGFPASQFMEALGDAIEIVATFVEE